MTQEERHELIAEIAEVIAGLQVPYSIPQIRPALGAAGDGWLKIWRRLHIFGWQDEESIKLILTVALLDS